MCVMEAMSEARVRACEKITCYCKVYATINLCNNYCSETILLQTTSAPAPETPSPTTPAPATATPATATPETTSAPAPETPSPTTPVPTPATNTALPQDTFIYRFLTPDRTPLSPSSPTPTVSTSTEEPNTLAPVSIWKRPVAYNWTHVVPQIELNTCWISSTLQMLYSTGKLNGVWEDIVGSIINHRITVSVSEEKEEQFEKRFRAFLKSLIVFEPVNDSLPDVQTLYNGYSAQCVVALISIKAFDGAFSVARRESVTSGSGDVFTPVIHDDSISTYVYYINDIRNFRQNEKGEMEDMEWMKDIPGICIQNTHQKYKCVAGVLIIVPKPVSQAEPHFVTWASGQSSLRKGGNIVNWFDNKSFSQNPEKLPYFTDNNKFDVFSLLILYERKA